MIPFSRLPSRLVRSAGTLAALAILVFALGVAIEGAWSTRAVIDSSFQEQKRIEDGQLTLEQMLKIQLDEQNYIRAFVITRDPSYIDSYNATGLQFYNQLKRLQDILAREGLTDTLAALRDYESTHHQWHLEVADPLLAHPTSSARELDKRGKALIDAQSEDARYIEGQLEQKNQQVLASTQDQINRALWERVLWLVFFGVLTIFFFGLRSRLTSELEEERFTTQTLQRAFRSEHVPLPNCTIGSAYGAASSHLAVGGDVFDVHRLSDRLGLILIADVSGKGVDAAVLTAFIKFTIRGIALRRRDPGFILQEFNRAFPRTVENPYLFVSMFVGILDTISLRLDYASAGHDVAFIRRPNEVEQLAVTGPVLGVMEEPFGVKTVYLDDGDTIVLSTDGLTESRDSHGNLLDTSGAMEWIREEAPDPDHLANRLIERARKRSGKAMRDDVAVLVIRVGRVPVAASKNGGEYASLREDSIADA